MSYEELRWKKFPVLDDGFVTLVDVMGDDSSVVQAARVSYGKDDRTENTPVTDEGIAFEKELQKKDRDLIRYLMRHRHTTPFEMCEVKLLIRVPMDCWRQWIRHRTACLTGDTHISFDLPGAKNKGRRSHYSKSIEELHRLWHKGASQTADRAKKSHYLDEVEENRLYSASELANAVRRDDVQIRQLVGRGRLQATDSKPMQIKGKWWHDYAKNGTSSTAIVPMKERIRAMSLRCLNEETGEVIHTSITDIWCTGEKDVIELEFSNGTKLTATHDHMCFTNEGWVKLGIAVSKGLKFASAGKKKPSIRKTTSFSKQELKEEEWRRIQGYQGRYEVSNLGRVRSWVEAPTGRIADRPKIKRLTKAGDRFVVGLSKRGETKTYHVHMLVASAFLEPKPVGMQCRHKDGNSFNNRASNLAWGTAQDNTNDRMTQGGDQRLFVKWVDVIAIRSAGKQRTYDLSVEGPFHNFFADGIVVHNSVNEYSTRYTEAIDSQQTTKPDEWRLQATNNKQGSSGFLEKWPRDITPVQCGTRYEVESPPYMMPIALEELQRSPGHFLSILEGRFHKISEWMYKTRLKFGVAKEQARKDFPLSTYTEAYWKIDLHNLFHFLALRMHSHAQKEIRDFATTIGNEIVAKLFPVCWEAFCDYRLGAMFLSRLEVEAVAMRVEQQTYGDDAGYDWESLFTNKQELEECRVKLEGLRLL